MNNYEKIVKLNKEMWDDIDIFRQWQILESINVWGYPKHKLVERTCSGCGKKVKNSDEKLNKENNSKKDFESSLQYGYYQWIEDSEIKCRDCISQEKKNLVVEWIKTIHMWNTHLSTTEKNYYFLHTSSPEMDENLLLHVNDLKGTKMEDLDLVYQWWIVQNVGDDDTKPLICDCDKK